MRKISAAQKLRSAQAEANKLCMTLYAVENGGVDVQRIQFSDLMNANLDTAKKLGFTIVLRPVYGVVNTWRAMAVKT